MLNIEETESVLNSMCQDRGMHTFRRSLSRLPGGDILTWAVRIKWELSNEEDSRALQAEGTI